jgi:hypothetical protein
MDPNQLQIQLFIAGLGLTVLLPSLRFGRYETIARWLLGGLLVIVAFLWPHLNSFLSPAFVQSISALASNAWAWFVLILLASFATPVISLFAPGVRRHSPFDSRLLVLEASVGELLSERSATQWSRVSATEQSQIRTQLLTYASCRIGMAHNQIPSSQLLALDLLNIFAPLQGWAVTLIGQSFQSFKTGMMISILGKDNSKAAEVACLLKSSLDPILKTNIVITTDDAGAGTLDLALTVGTKPLQAA